MSENWVMKSIEPKSDQLNADDLLTGPIDVTVADVKRGNAEQPIVIEIGDGRQPFKPGKSMRRVLIKLWGDSPKQWIGRRMRLYCDPAVKFGGVKVGGIRISHMSHIETKHEIMLTVTRGKKDAHVVEPMSGNAPDNRVDKAIDWMETVDSLEKLEKGEKNLNELIAEVGGEDAELLWQARKKAIDRLAK